MRRCHRVVCSLPVLAFLAAPLAAQQTQPPPQPAQSGLVAPPDWLYNDIACAPIFTTRPAGTLRIVGSQDTAVRQMFATGDTVVISGGSGGGIQAGQRYFVRRHVTEYGNGMAYGAKSTKKEHPISVHTVGWIQVVGVDSMVATAKVLHACDGIALDDYLDEFIEPMIAANPVPGSTPQYTQTGHILGGDNGIKTVGAAGQMVTIDRGTSAGVVPGQRYLVFRDKRARYVHEEYYSKALVESAERLPMAEVGEVIVLTVGADQSTAQVVFAKDAIIAGDYIAEIR